MARQQISAQGIQRKLDSLSERLYEDAAATDTFARYRAYAAGNIASYFRRNHRIKSGSALQEAVEDTLTRAESSRQISYRGTQRGYEDATVLLRRILNKDI